MVIFGRILSFIGLLIHIAAASDEVIMVIGGQGMSSVEILTPGMSEPPPECQGIADLPFYSGGAVGLLNKDNQGMVCGGKHNPGKKSCHYYDNVANQWVKSDARLFRKRHQAETVRIGRGYRNADYRIFGGLYGKSIELYDGETGTFRLSSYLPYRVGFDIGSCAAYSDVSGEPHIWFMTYPNPAYDLPAPGHDMWRINLNTGEFLTWPSPPSDSEKQMACGVSVNSNTGTEIFHFQGGIRKPRSERTCPSTNWAHLTTDINSPSDQGSWASGHDPEFCIYGSASLRVGNMTSALIGGADCETKSKANWSNRFEIWIMDGADEEVESPWVSERPHRQMEEKRKQPVAIVGYKEDLCRKIT